LLEILHLLMQNLPCPDKVMQSLEAFFRFSTLRTSKSTSASPLVPSCTARTAIAHCCCQHHCGALPPAPPIPLPLPPFLCAIVLPVLVACRLQFCHLCLSCLSAAPLLCRSSLSACRSFRVASACVLLHWASPFGSSCSEPRKTKLVRA
jgi:hypothetical protein